MHADAVGTRRDRAFTLGQNAELQTGFGAVHAFTLAVFIQVFLAIGRHLLETLATYRVSAFVDFTQRAVNGFHRHLRLIAFQRIGNAGNQCFRQQPLQAGFAQLLSNLQADAVTCLRFNSVKSRGCHLLSLFFGGEISYSTDSR